MGAVQQIRKENPTMFYGHVDHPVKTADDWQEYKLLFDAASVGRFPRNWDEAVVPSLNESKDPVGIVFFPFFFRLGFYSMGMERFLTAFYEEPDLIHRMFAHWSNFAIDMLKRFWTLFRWTTPCLPRIWPEKMARWCLRRYTGSFGILIKIRLSGCCGSTMCRLFASGAPGSLRSFYQT